MTLVVIIVFLVLALFGMPLAFALGLAAVAGLDFGGLDIAILPQRAMHGVDSFPLMAIPLFILAGQIMVIGGAMRKLIDFANAIIGHIHGGLAHVSILAGMILASVSGASVASASALGSTLVPSMRKQYDIGYSSAVIASASNLGAVIPPSNAMIVYALMAGSSVSVGALFLAGIVPGLILTIGFMALASLLAWRRGYSRKGSRATISVILTETAHALPIILMPVIVVGGIIGGVFTATEGAAIAVVYALLLGIFYRKLRLRDLPKAMFNAAVTSAMIGALIGFASAVTFVFTVDLFPVHLSHWIQSFTTNPEIFMLIVMVMLIGVGMFIESNAAFIMLVPLFAPIALQYGIDPLQFGFLFVFNIIIGMMTPPVGVLLFVMCGISRISLSTLVKSAWPFILLQYVVLAACFIFPEISTGLPHAVGY